MTGWYVEQHPGRARPGLIEAPDMSSAMIRSIGGHPGRARPGLIEAAAAAAPGMPIAVHPGRARPGLIEAFTAWPASPPSIWHPGRARPGRIEAHPAHSMARGHPPSIRGARAPASLKHLSSAFPGLGRSRHPGRARPGLIEATASRSSDRPWSGASGARAPRPH